MPPSIFDAAGGWPAFLALAAAHHRRCLEDPVLSHPFSHGVHPDHVERLAAYWAEVLGGPPRFTREFGDHTAMLWMHAGHDMETDLATRFYDCFVSSFDEAGLPDDAALRDALRAYMSWAVDDVMAVSPRGSTVGQGLRVPRWGWDGPI